MKPIRLRIKFGLVAIVVDVLVVYMDFLSRQPVARNIATREKEYRKIEFSICYNLYLHYNQKQHVAHPPEKTVSTLSNHDALVLQNALLYYCGIINDVFKNNKAETIKNDLNQLIVNQEHNNSITVYS